MKAEAVAITLVLFFSLTFKPFVYSLNFEESVLSSENAINPNSFSISPKSVNPFHFSRCCLVVYRFFYYHTGWIVNESSSFTIKKFCEYPLWSKGTFV